MKILFLDFDGVIVTHRQTRARRLSPEMTHEERLRQWADPVAVEQLNRVIYETGAALVVSSTWRKVKAEPTSSASGAYAEFVQETASLDYVIRVLRIWGVKGLIVGVTPVLTTEVMITAADGRRIPLAIGHERGKEIQAWLNKNPKMAESFAIVDDEDDMAHLKDRLVRTRFENGLTPALADRLIEMLGRKGEK